MRKFKVGDEVVFVQLLTSDEMFDEPSFFKLGDCGRIEKIYPSITYGYKVVKANGQYAHFSAVELKKREVKFILEI